MSHYGDRGNLLVIAQRCKWRGIEVEVKELDLHATFKPGEIDLFLVGGGADVHQRLIAKDLVYKKGPALKESIEQGAVVLAVCAGYQMLGHYYKTARGNDLPGLHVFDAYTVHRATQVNASLDSIPEAGEVRSVQTLIVEWQGTTLVGFENHGGRTYLNPGAKPLGRVLVGGGNNSEDKTEGCVYKNAIGTYLHGPLLPKNPHFADFLISKALSHRVGTDVELSPLNDELEFNAHKHILSTYKVAV